MIYNHFSMLPEGAFKPRCGRKGMTLEGGGSPPPMPTQTSQVSIPEYAKPYMEALLENLNKGCSDKREVTKLVEDNKVKALPVQFIRGKTIDDILIVEEAQNLTKGEMLAILTRLGKTGKIVINGDNEQTDINSKTGEINGLSYVIELSKKLEEIKWIKLKENHRSDLVGKILEFEYGK